MNQMPWRLPQPRKPSSWTMEFTVTRETDPGYEIGAVVWVDSKQDGLLRPEFRRRARVAAREELPDGVRYTVEAAPRVQGEG